MGPDDAAAAVSIIRVVIVGVIRRSIDEPRAEVMATEVMAVGEPNATAVEHRTGAKTAASKYGTATSEAAGVERRPATTEAAGVERRPATTEASAAMEATATAAMEATAAATMVTTSAAATMVTTSATSAAADFRHQPAGHRLRDGRCARIAQRHRLSTLTRCGRERQHRGRRKARAHQPTAAPGI
jgi:hypothetical protein